MQHHVPLKPTNSPAKHATPTCDAKIQHANNDDDEQPVLRDNEIKHI